MIWRVLILAGLLGGSTVVLAAPWNAGPGEIFKPGGTVAPSCNAIITGSGADGNAILTGSATALANLTCQ